MKKFSVSIARTIQVLVVSILLLLGVAHYMIGHVIDRNGDTFDDEYAREEQTRGSRLIVMGLLVLISPDLIIGYFFKAKKES